jgi:hypothetical protein
VSGAGEAISTQDTMKGDLEIGRHVVVISHMERVHTSQQGGQSVRKIHSPCARRFWRSEQSVRRSVRLVEAWNPGRHDAATCAL